MLNENNDFYKDYVDVDTGKVTKLIKDPEDARPIAYAKKNLGRDTALKLEERIKASREGEPNEAQLAGLETLVALSENFPDAFLSATIETKSGENIEVLYLKTPTDVKTTRAYFCTDLGFAEVSAHPEPPILGLSKTTLEDFVNDTMCRKWGDTTKTMTKTSLPLEKSQTFEFSDGTREQLTAAYYPWSHEGESFDRFSAAIKSAEIFGVRQAAENKERATKIQPQNILKRVMGSS